MSSVVCFNLDQSKILLSGNGLKQVSYQITIENMADVKTTDNKMYKKEVN